MKILGIDPGYGIIGWAVIESNMSLLNIGVIVTPPSIPIEERLIIIDRELQTILVENVPDTAAIERLFFHSNRTTAVDVAKAIGIISLLLAKSKIPLSEYTPTQVKSALTGYGKAEKRQVQEMVQKLFKLTAPPQPDDAADALAIATCHSCSISRIPLC